MHAPPKSAHDYDRVGFGSLTDNPAAAPGMRPVNINQTFCWSNEQVQATPKSMNAYTRVKFGSLANAPVAGPGMRPVSMN